MKSCVLIVIGLVAISASRSDAQMFSGPNSQPSLKYKVKPGYTDRAKNAGLEGDAVVAVTVNEKGLPSDVEFLLFLQGPNPVQDSLGLDEMAVSAVKSWRFKAATKDGKPTSMRVEVVVEFRLLRSE